MTTNSIPDRVAPAFSFYPKDFIVGTVTLSLSERGAYITLLAWQWDSGGVPDDAVSRARILGCPVRQADVVWTRVSEKFQQGQDGLWRNARLEVERAKQIERRAALAANGLKGGRPPKPDDNQKDNQTETNRFSETSPDTSPPDNQKQSLSSSSSSSSSYAFAFPEKERMHLRACEEAEAETNRAEFSQRAGAFCQYYEDTHARLFGVAYMGTQKDYQVALQLCAKFTDLELQEAAVVWFAMEDQFARTGTRTVPKFATRATECVAKVKALDARGMA